MVLVQFELSDGGLIFINAKHVTVLVPASHDPTSSLTDVSLVNSTTWRVKGTVLDIVRKLDWRF